MYTISANGVCTLGHKTEGRREIERKKIERKVDETREKKNEKEVDVFAEVEARVQTLI